jgi:hypothetical protein
MTSACAACRGGTEPRTRRRWPSRAVRTGSNTIVASPSCHVVVLCPHHVSVPVTVVEARPSILNGLGSGLRASRWTAAGLSPAHPDARCREAIGTKGAGSHTCLPSIAMEVLVPVRPPSPVRRHRLRRRQAQQVAECWVNRCNFHIRHPPLRDQIWVRPAGNAAATVNGPRCLGRL